MLHIFYVKMPKMERPLWLLCIVFIQLMHLCSACQIEGFTNWHLRLEERILDTHNGVVLDRNTSDIIGINSIVYNEGLNRGPYIDVKYENSRFIVETRSNFSEYEEHETSKTMRVTVSFNCAQGSTNQLPLVIQIHIIDTNQNAPRFLPSDNYEFTVIPPLPPGFLVTGCDNQIIARDIDLTTRRVDFTIEENDYFEIFNDSTPATKEFSATLRAKMFIRSIPDDFSFKIMATDVDETNDPPLTTEGTVRIISDTQFQLPEELQFSKIFYLLNYTNENLLTDEFIFLNRGYDDQVTFSFQGDHKEYFEMTPNGNRITFRVKSEIPTEILREQQIYLIIRAEREHTSGAAATIIIQLPTASELSFELHSYKGVIDGINLVHQDIFLNQVYNEDVVFGIRGDYANLFNQTSNGNQLIISLRTQLPQEIVTSNNIITLEITATGDYTNIAVSTLIFEIIKDDLTTPVFAKKIYEGKYVNSTHVSIEEISLTQGYDGTVDFEIFGEHAEYFRIENDDGNVIVSLRYAIPEDLIFSAKIFTLYIVATKLNTVGANAALVIRFPNELTELAVMEFSKHTYMGTLENKVVSIENVILESGFTNQVRFVLSGEYYNYFTYSTKENVISILASEELHQNLGNEDNIILNVRAERVNAIPVTTSIIIRIVKKEIIQPVFENPYYKGIYTENVGLQFNDVIKLTSGFDVTVTFDLQGEHSQWFYITEDEDSVILHSNTTNSIPNDFIVNNKQIVLTIIANKPEATVGRTVIVIELNAEIKDSSLSFERIYYVGSLDKNKITLDTINLRGNLHEPYEVTLHGDLANYFSTSTQGDGLGIILEQDLPEDGLPDNDIITLEIRATRNTTIAQATVVLKIIKEIDDKPTIKPIRFNRAYYTGQYSTNGLSFPDIISLSGGFDDTVEFELVGESSQWFYITQDENSVRLYENSTNSLPNQVLESNNQIVFTILAKKPGVLSAEAAVLIEFIKELDDTLTIKPIRFNRAYYTGQYSTNELSFPDIISLSGGFDDTVEFELVGESSQWFYITQDENSVRLYENSTNSLPNQVLESNNQIVFTILAKKPGVLSAEAAVLIEFIKELDDTLTIKPIRFNRAYYTGQYSNYGLNFADIISLSVGFGDTVEFELVGESSQWFFITQDENSVRLYENSTNSLPNQVLESNNQIVFTILAKKPGVLSAEAAVLIEFIKELDDTLTIKPIRFNRAYYTGQYSTNELSFPDIISLSGGFDDTVEFELVGESSQWFYITQDENSVRLYENSTNSLPYQVLESNNQIVFTILAKKPGVLSAEAAVLIEFIKELDDTLTIKPIRFNRAYYTGQYSTNELSFPDIISLSGGFDDTVEFELVGESSQWFYITQDENSVRLYENSTNSLPYQVLESNNQIVFTILAKKPGVLSAEAAVLIEFIKELDDTLTIKPIRFNRAYYTGQYSTNELSFPDIISLSGGFDDTVEFELVGESSQWFYITQDENSVRLYENSTNSLPYQVLESNNQIVFTILAKKPGVLSAEAAVLIEFIKELDDTLTIKPIRFNRAYYTGQYSTDGLNFADIISLSVGFDDTVEFELVGESSQWFFITQDENSVRLYENSTNSLPNQVLESNNQIVFTILAKKPGVLSAEAAVLIEFIKELEDTLTIKPIRFNRAYYTGQYSTDGLNFADIISLSVGFDDTVEFELVGESSQWFYITQDENSVRLYENSTNTLPNQVVEIKNQIVFTVLANKPGALFAEAAIFIEIIQESSEYLRFDRAYYVGSLNKSGITLDAITLIGNYDDTYSVTLHGNYANYFSITPQRPVFEIVLQREVSEDLLNNDFITFEIRVSKNDVITARATTILRIIKDNEPPVINGIQFDRVYYVGTYTSQNVFTFEDTISLAEGYDETVTYSLYGDQSTWFELVPTGSSAKMTLSRQVPSDVVSSNSQLIFEVHANRASDTASARSTIIITIEDVDDGSSPIMKFERQAYVGTINQSVIFLDPIVLAEGYNDEVTFSLIGELNGYFSTPNDRNVLTLTLLRPIPEENIPINRLITMDIQAISEYTSARAAIVLKIVQNEESVESLSFDKPYYSGSYAGASEFSFDFIIRLESGFDETIQFKLEGDDSTWFRLRQSGNTAELELSSSIPESIINNIKQLVFVVYAQRVGSEVVLTRSVIIIAVTNDPITDVKFDKVLYLGRVENNAVAHEVITVEEFSGNVQVSGEYSHLFRTAITNGVVTVTLSGTSVPSTLSYVALKLIADEANAVLLLDIYRSDTPVDPPSLAFSSSSYILEANEGSTGEVGRVTAVASNGENVIYSLEIENEHLKQRLTVNSNGEIHLSASANLGVYSFKATARTRISQVSASAAIQLTIFELGTTFNLPPLIVLERDEEEPHLNLVPLDRTKYPNCEYSLSNKWPLDQNWLYVDSEGLHTRSIDREHDSIAFMPVSQIQVELNLNCNKRSKRSNVDTIDYGSNKWILTDSISYNPSRTLVNLIVRDINDNAPKFEADSVTVGYPSGDLAEIVLPRALAELKATDADIEENALLRYMSSDERFVVSPTSGSVHLRNRVTLEDNTRLVVEAVDRNGTGLKGSVEIMVRLLDRNQIAVVTVPNRFLDDESTILDELTNAVGYDVKPLRTTVISESRYDNEGDKSRVRRDVNTNGASLRLYVYGLKQREPVDVTQLTDDLRNTMVTVSLARVLSLEDHLDELQICPAFEREIGLLAATIVLAVLLLIIILVFGVWFYLRRKMANDYDQFSDQNSLRSRNDSVESPKVEPVFTTPRLIGIEELRKSEKKLQERLDAPKEIPEKASSKNVEKTEAIINVSETDSKWPIVIQSIDKLKDNTDESDDDEFGEKVRPRRKSVVTFNENVEKIIHLEDVSVDDNSEADVEVHKF